MKGDVREPRNHRRDVVGLRRRGNGRFADLHRDDDVGPHRPGRLHGQVLRAATVHEEPAVVLHRGEERGNRHAGPHGVGEASFGEDDGVAGLHVHGHRAERDAQVVELSVRRAGDRLPLQYERKLAARDEAGRKREPLFFKPASNGRR